VKQFVRLGIGASDAVVRDYILARIEKRRKPLAKARKLSRWLPKVHYLTKYGAAELAEIYKLPIEHYKYPSGQVQFSERLARHRFAQIDFHIGLRLWAHHHQDADITFADMDFDVEGSRRTGDFRPVTTIDILGEPHPVIADGLFGLTANNQSLIYALEVHRTTQTKAVAMQIKRYMDVLESGSISSKYDVDHPVLVCSVHTKENVLKGVKAYLLKLPHFHAFRHHFLFNTTEQLAHDFSEGWELADGTPTDPFPKSSNPVKSKLIE